MANPVIISHNIDPTKVVFAYRAADADSLEVAQYYAQVRQLDDCQLCPLTVPAINEIDWDTYYNQIEVPLLAWIDNLKSSGVDHAHCQYPFIFCVILGFNIPKIVDYNGTKLAVASRVHRLGHDIYLKRPNHCWDRKFFRFFDDRDNSQLYVTAVIDGPTKQDAINLINRSLTVTNQGKIGGKIFLDPFGNKDTELQLNYQQEILDFITYDIDSLGSFYETTTDIEDPYKDPTFLFLEEDSFYWGWFTDTTSPQFFQDTRTIRTFLYNADDRGASNIKEVPEDSGYWPNLAILSSNPGYAATAGAVDPPDEDAYLYPRPFFEALHRGAGIGEAFLYASKYVDWKLVLFGDPLATVNFPLPHITKQYTLSNTEMIRTAIRAVESYLNRMDRLNTMLDNAIDFFVLFGGFDEMNIFYDTVDWRTVIGDTNISYNYIANIFSSLNNYQAITTGMSFSNWLNSENIFVSASFREVFGKFTSTSIAESMVFAAGTWELNFTYEHTDLTLEDVNFVIEVATDSKFENIVHIISSAENNTGWQYEREINEFFQLPETGLSSNYGGRKIRYVSPSNYLLTHTEEYWFKVYIDDSGARTVHTDQQVI